MLSSRTLMKTLYLGLCSVLLSAPTLLASTIYNTSASNIFSYTGSATYQVVAGSGGITSQNFTTPAATTDPNTLTLVLNYGVVKNAKINTATLDLSQVVNSGPVSAQVSLSDNPNPGHLVGSDPTFAGATTGLFVSIVGTLSGTQTINLANATSYNLLPFFSKDLVAGNSLTIHLSLGNVFSTPTLASGTWKNETATYTLTQLVSDNINAATRVDYTTPEPATLFISGAGLVLLSVLARKKLTKA